MIGLGFSIRKVRQMREWPETSGRILESTTCGEWVQSGKGSLWIVKPKIAYRYFVNGKEHVGHDIAASEINTASEEVAKEKIVPYPVGKEVAVYYNPSKPQESFLENTSTAAPDAILGAVAILLFSVGVLALLGIIHL
jgi:hypothetical protein